jgi:hypothetical protein
MFDTTHLHTHKSPIVNVKVEQKPHDTADAARLYGECEAKAKAAIAGATVDALGANNELKVLVCGTFYRAMQGDQVVRLVFKLNGQLHDMEVPLDRHAMVQRAYDVVGRELLGHIGSCLASGRSLTTSESQK